MKHFSKLAIGTLLACAVLVVPFRAEAQTLEWSPESMWIQDTVVGTTAWATLTLTARVAPVTINSIEWTYNQPGMMTWEPQFGYVADRSVPTVLAVDESMDIEISFSPEEAFSFASALLLITNDSLNAAALSYYVEGNGAEPSSCDPLASCGGICTDLDNDVNSCGSCYAVCPVPENGAATCEAGACGAVCDEGYQLEGGECVLSCGELENCGGVCIDTSADLANCGGCDVACSAPENGAATCEAGACGFVCDEGYEADGAGCVLIPVGGGDLADMIADIIDFFDESRADGSLVGFGPGASAEHRADALGNMLETAEELILAEEWDQACGQMRAAYLRTDGSFPPPDFVAGENTAVLGEMIWNLGVEMDCPMEQVSCSAAPGAPTAPMFLLIGLVGLAIARLRRR